MSDLLSLIEDVERRHFRTPFDTGANWNALIIWNTVRAHAGLPNITLKDLATKAGMTWEEYTECKRRLQEQR